MRVNFSAVVGFVIAAITATSVHAQAPANRSAVEKDLIEKERAAVEAFAKADAKRYYRAIGWDTALADPLGMQANAMAQTRVESYTVDDFKVTWLGETSAVVTYRWSGKATRFGEPLPAHVYSSTVWTKRDDTWVASLHQETPTTAPKK